MIALAGALVPLAYAVMLIVDFDTAARGLQYVTDDEWIPDLGIRYSLGVDGLNLWLVGLTALLFAASALWIALRPPERARLFSVHFGIAETAVLGAFLRPGPGAVRPVLRPDARAVLLPGRAVGRAGARAGGA